MNDSRIYYETKKKDVLEMEFEPGVCYSMFNAFHHFSNEEKRKIVKRIQASTSIAFFVEVLEPGIACFLKVFFLTTIGTLLFSPFVKPFSLKRLFFTYILPINMITITCDGLISVLKSNSVMQYGKIFEAYEDSVEIVRLNSLFNPLIVIQVRSKK